MSGRLTAYDVADHYDEEYFADLSARYRRRNRFARRRIANVLSLLPDVQSRVLLDLGCGMGTFTLEAARRGARAIGLDMMPAALRAATRVAAQEQVAGARFALGDVAALPARSQSADVILAADLTEHLDDQTFRAMLRETKRVLKPGGYLVIYTPESTHVFERLRHAGVMAPDPSHIGVRSGRELAAEVQRAGFTVERLRYLPSHLPGWNLLERAFARWLPLLRRRAGVVARRPSS
ncbi:MAG: class I SAM-dependent methyltransferase [Longimicrobiales bacterium]